MLARMLVASASQLLAVLPARIVVVRCSDGVVLEASDGFRAEAPAARPGVPLVTAWRSLAVALAPTFVGIREGTWAANVEAELAGSLRQVSCRRLDVADGSSICAVVTVAPATDVSPDVSLAAVHCGIVIEDAGGHVVVTNPMALELLGSVFGAGWQDAAPGWALVDADGQPLAADRLAPTEARVRRTAVGRQVVGVRGPGGTERWLTLDAEPVLADDGELRALVTTVAERTELTQLVHTLAACREVIDAGTDGFFARDLRTGLVLHSARLNALVGLAAVDTEVDTRAWRDRVHPDDVLRVSSTYDDVLAGRQERFDLMHRIRHEDGGYRWVRSRGKVVARDDAGQAVRLAGTVTDMNSAKQAEAALVDSERRLARATASGKVGLWEVNLTTGEAWRTPHHAAIFGASGPWSMASFRAAVVPEDVQVVDGALEVCRRAGEMHFECRIRRPDGRVRWVDITAEARVGSDGTTQYITGTVADITARKWIELDLSRAILAAEHRVGELERALADTGALTGLVSICMHCKSVRDAEDTWTRIEVYVAAHSTVRFSHGICPTCSEIYYPDS